MKILLNPYESEGFNSKNRFVMAPLTRQRAGNGLVPNELNALYYAQRASAGLIVSEATQISPQGQGYVSTPGIYSEDQVEGWKTVTEAVHNAGGLIFCQLWHVGRHSHPEILLNGGWPVGPSAIPETGLITTPSGKAPVVIPHALSKDQIKRTVEDFALAAANAIRAGFDGVEVHGANGYLIDQFLNDSSNTREDEYGGSIENKCRFAMEVVDAVVGSIGNKKAGIRLSPSGTNFGVRNLRPVDTFEYLIQNLNRFQLSYLHLIEPVQSTLADLPDYLRRVTTHFRSIYSGTLITSAGYNFETAEEAIRQGDTDLVAFGKNFISNPDLIRRYALDHPLNPWDMATFYGGNEAGYTDYPFMK